MPLKAQTRAIVPSRMKKISAEQAFRPYPSRKITSRNRTVNYREIAASLNQESVIHVSEPSLPDIVFVWEQHRANAMVVLRQNRAGDLFKSLPFEIHQSIASFFDTDRDVVAYARVCRKTNDSTSVSVWRQRFIRTFDMVEGNPEALVLAQKYALRRDISKWTCFDLKKWGGRVSRECREEQATNQEKCLIILRTLIVESNARRGRDAFGNDTIIGLNHNYMRDWISHRPETQDIYTDIIDAVANTVNTSWELDDIVSAASDNSLVLVIQLCLTYLSLHPHYCNNNVSRFDLSQQEAYADHKKQPVFIGGWKQDINVRWLLHTVNFFKFHLKAPNGEGLLAHEYHDYKLEQLPQPWLGKIKEGTQPLGSHWKSAYTFMRGNNELLRLRIQGNDKPIVDESDGGELLSDLIIFFDESKFSTADWPKAFETLIKSDPYPTSNQLRTRQLRSFNVKPFQKYELKAFYGTSRGSRPAHFYGRIHGLPEQQGIPGFQRITLIKFCHIDGEYDCTQVWGYEGCVLPGGRIIVGRWWDLTADSRSPINIFGGPFIWWNVDDSAAEPPITSQEALDFLDSIHDPQMGF